MMSRKSQEKKIFRLKDDSEEKLSAVSKWNLLQ